MHNLKAPISFFVFSLTLSCGYTPHPKAPYKGSVEFKDSSVDQAIMDTLVGDAPLGNDDRAEPSFDVPVDARMVEDVRADTKTTDTLAPDTHIPDAGGSCLVDGDCPAGNAYCVNLRCVACKNHSQCNNDAGVPFCSTANTCVSCAGADAGCSGGNSVCDSTSGRCVECLVDKECKTSEKAFCKANVCVGCNEAGGTNVCTGAKPECAASGACVAAVPSPRIISFGAKVSNICAGTNGALIAIFENGVGTISSGDFSAVLQSGVSIAVTPTSTTSYRLSVTNTAGATATIETALTVKPHGAFFPTDSLHVARGAHSAVLLSNGKVLIVGGLDSTSVPTSSVETYDPITGQFAQTSRPMGSARQGFAITLLGATGANANRVLIAGGMDNTGVKLATAEIYDPATDAFSPTGGGMNIARRGATAVLVTKGANAGMVLLLGGNNLGLVGLLNTELFNPATLGGIGSFIPGPTTVTGMSNRAVVPLLNGKILILGGFSVDNEFNYLATSAAEIFDPASSQGGQFTPTMPLTIPRDWPVATRLQDGSVLVTGGTDSDNIPSNKAELYDASGITILTVGTMTAARTTPTSTLLQNGKVLVTGGAGLSTAELYDPISRTFSPTGEMTSRRGLASATLLPNGSVLLAGGTNSSGALATAEVYCP